VIDYYRGLYIDHYYLGTCIVITCNVRKNHLQRNPKRYIEVNFSDGKISFLFRQEKHSWLFHSAIVVNSGYCKDSGKTCLDKSRYSGLSLSASCQQNLLSGSEAIASWILAGDCSIWKEKQMILSWISYNYHYFFYTQSVSHISSNRKDLKKKYNFWLPQVLIALWEVNLFKHNIVLSGLPFSLSVFPFAIILFSQG